MNHYHLEEAMDNMCHLPLEQLQEAVAIANRFSFDLPEHEIKAVYAVCSQIVEINRPDMSPDAVWCDIGSIINDLDPLRAAGWRVIYEFVNKYGY